MNIKKISLFLMTVFLGIFIVACDGTTSQKYNDDIYAIYTLGLEADLIDMSYEDWLESIRGEDAENVSFQVSNGFLQWKRESQSTWTNLFELSTLVGTKGDKGEDGKDVTFRVADGQIQWQYLGDDSWTNLIQVSTLIGPKGDKGDAGQDGEDGSDGKEIVLRVDSGFIQYQYSGDIQWTNLIEIESLVGAKGDKGDAGQDGINGKEISLNVQDGFIQWQYEGDDIWTDLIDLSTLVGAKGDKGDTGQDGVDGLTPHIGENGNWFLGNHDTGVSAIVNDIKMQLQEMVDHIFIEVYENTTLSKYVTINSSNIDTTDNYSINVKLIHEFTKNNSTFDPVYYNQNITSNLEVIDLEVPFHGLFDLEVTLSLQKNGDTYTRKITRPVAYSAPEYNFAWLNGTMPALLLASDILSNNNEKPTYVELIRPKTYMFNNLQGGMMKFPVAVSPTKGNYNQNPFAGDVFINNVSMDGDNLTTRWLEELYFINPLSKFTIMSADNRVQFTNSLLNSSIPLSNLNFVYYTDGSGTASKVNNSFSTQNSFDQIYSEFVNNVLNGSGNFSVAHTLAATKHEKFELVVNSIDGWNIDEELRNNILNEYNVRVVSTQDAFSRVELAGNLDKLEYLLGTRWGSGEFDGISYMFQGEPSKNLLILGTSTAGEINSTYATFENYITYIVETYGDEYKIFYKGHPSYPSSGARLQMFENYGIQIIPNSIPVETVMLLYPEIYIGGYHGTSFQSSLPGQTVFFFGTEARVKSNTTLKGMIESGEIFYNTVYLTVDLNGDVLPQ